jgi:hypothetical protein
MDEPPVDDEPESYESVQWSEDDWRAWYESRPGPRPLVVPPTIVTVDPGPYL